MACCQASGSGGDAINRVVFMALYITRTRHDINTIWDDRVLDRAYQVFGNVPAVVLREANGVVPQALMERLAQCITPSGVPV